MKEHEDQDYKESQLEACECDGKLDHDQSCSCPPLHPCPEKIPTPRFRSPNSPLPPAELDELQECIEVANHLLRSLSNERNPNNQRQLQLHLLDLRDILIRVKVYCQEKQIEEVGTLVTAGKNFIKLNTVGKRVFILFNKIDSLQYEECNTEKKHQQELIHLNRQLKRELVLHFGEFVSGEPELVNLFFGIPIHLMLFQFVGCQVEVMVEDKSEAISGQLLNADENFLHLLNKEEMEQIPFAKACLIRCLFNRDRDFILLGNQKFCG
ncbi:hypothetical protein [Bacillus sp. 1NLA3E]|uniref:hypothetical protein n=1 Tax=Bacillus sp. 1NLA3E TaxID=666686 RepID=UPI000247E85C|nr:hypothetical protein [Bacillus sp. 1NLA3E]AGK55890.1 hypothetical protein B1NLA3E_20760 [Bacillus sp. 1NLA3E]